MPELVEKTVELFNDLDERIGEKERAPLLGALEIEVERKSMEIDQWMKVVLKYWTRWGSKGCVVSELEGIASGDDERVARLVEMMKRRTEEGHASNVPVE